MSKIPFEDASAETEREREIVRDVASIWSKDVVALERHLLQAEQMLASVRGMGALAAADPQGYQLIVNARLAYIALKHAELAAARYFAERFKRPQGMGGA
jgi:hypothetical protein